MAETEIDWRRLAKVVALFASDTDGEALVALRRATAIIEQAGLSWDDVLDRAQAAGKRMSHSDWAAGLRRCDRFTVATVRRRRGSNGRAAPGTSP